MCSVRSCTPAFRSPTRCRSRPTARTTTSSRPKLATVREAMMRGDGLARPISGLGLFPPAARQMIRVGESTGSLDVQLQNAAMFYERELSFRLKRVTDMFEPAIIIVVGGDGRVRRGRADLRDVQHLPPSQDLIDEAPPEAATVPRGTTVQGGQRSECSGERSRPDATCVRARVAAHPRAIRAPRQQRTRQPRRPAPQRLDAAAHPRRHDI